MAGSQPLEVQERQSEWMADHHRYLIDRFASDCSSCLDVGCGAGYVTGALSDMIDIRGVDIDPEQVNMGKARGLKLSVSDGMALPYGDSSFDLVICSFYLMWVKDRSKALDEMMRVSRKKVLILAEPVWSATMTEPRELNELAASSIRGIRKNGGDPDAGLEVLNLLRRAGKDHGYGTIPLDTTPEGVMSCVQAEADLNGAVLSVPEPLLFHVPFIWAYTELSR